MTITALSTISSRIVLFAGLWWVLTEAATGSWYIGLPVVALAALISLVLLPGFSLSLFGILHFMSFFFWHSMCGGVDVARRALHPRLPISPGMANYYWSLPPGLPRIFMANTVSLLPGTLSVDLNETCLRVHILDKTSNFHNELVIIEERVAKLFALNLLATESTVHNKSK